MLRAELKVLNGRHAGETIPLRRKFLIGREPDCHLRPNSDLVSRHHCVFTVDDYTVRLRDLGSTNGTFLNDERLQGQKVLSSGDRVRVGRLEFEVIVHEGVIVDDPPSTVAPILEMAPDVEPAASQAAGAASAPPSDETTELKASETVLEMPAAPATADPASSTIVGGDTAATPTAPGQQPAPVPPPAYPPGVPPQPYPPQYAGYPPPGMPYPIPGTVAPYGAPGAVYPPPMPAGYPPQQQQPAGQAPQVAPPPIRLPDPDETGANADPQPEAPKPEASSDEGGGENPSQKAADIIRQYMQRRPTY